jgi:signal transduction histidine kinase
VVALGLATLLLLIVGSMLALSRRAQEIYAELDQLNTLHQQVDSKLRRLRSDVNLSGIFVRDYLLDIARERGPEYRAQIAEFREANNATLTELRPLTNGADAELTTLQATLDEYWAAFDPLFDWTPAEKIIRSAAFLRREVVPRRDAVLGIAQQIEEVNNQLAKAQRAEVAQRHAAFRGALSRLLWTSVLLGLSVALVVVFRLRVLERRSEEQRAAAADAERQLRQLSQQLVATQEEERKNLSRELHDHVAQVLTALRLELGRIERTAPKSDPFSAAVVECKRLLDSIFRTVRDLSLGLRPSMLDDFGLQPALEWHVRDFTRRSGLKVELQMVGDFDQLPDRYRICIYRAVQEALTNCARHARARSVQIDVTADADALSVVVADDGIGLDPQRRRTGLGLRGIEERVKELRGVMTIRGGVGRGTSLAFRLPLPIADQETTHARAAG